MDIIIELYNPETSGWDTLEFDDHSECSEKLKELLEDPNHEFSSIGIDSGRKKVVVEVDTFG